MGFLERFGGDGCAFEFKAGAHHIHGIFGPQAYHRLEIFLEAFDAVLRGGAKGAVFHLPIAVLMALTVVGQRVKPIITNR